jgi:S1-C subfamily serine protease
MVVKKINLIMYITLLFFISGGCWKRSDSGKSSTQKKKRVEQKGSELDPRVIAQHTIHSVVIIEAGNSQGSGFFIEQNIVATNYHVIEGESYGIAKIVSTNQTFEITKILAVDEIKDLALLSVAYNNGEPLPIGDDRGLSIGEKVYAIGNPKGLEGTFSEGIVSAIRELPSRKIIQITAPISSGSSGGPILNGSGQVIGVAVATILDGQNLNFAIPSSDLVGLINFMKKNY